MKAKPALVMLGAFLLIALPARSADPPFPDSISLLGSSVYNAADWNVNASQDGTIALDTPENGLKYLPDNATSGNSVRHQHIRTYTVQDGVAWATFRLDVTDGDPEADDIGFFFGLYTTDTDPFSGEPAQGAFITKATGTDQVVLKVKNSSGNNTANAMNIDPDKEYDFVIKVESGKTTFWHRPVGSAWSSAVVFDVSNPADHVPEDTAVLRFSGAVKTIDTTNTDFVTVRLFEFEANETSAPPQATFG